MANTTPPLTTPISQLKERRHQPMGRTISRTLPAINCWNIFNCTLRHTLKEIKMAKTETTPNRWGSGSQVFLSSEAQSQLKTMQRKLATLSDENWDKYASKGGQSRVVTLALTALDERLEKSPDTSHG